MVQAEAFVGDGSQLTGISSGPTGAATPVDECGTLALPGPYALTSNLPGAGGLLAGGDCLVLAADYVSLDLNRFDSKSVDLEL